MKTDIGEYKKQDIIQSFFNDVEYCDLRKSEMQKLLAEFFCDDRNTVRVYRGLTFDSHLYPTILRDISKDLNRCELREYESKVYEQYNRYSIQYLPYYENLSDWLASAQHFGLETRLIDWTYNPLVALYFAINNRDEDDYDSYIFATDVEYHIKEFFYFAGTTDEQDTYVHKRKWQLNKNLEWIDNKESMIEFYDNPKNKSLGDEFEKEVKRGEKLCFLKTNDANPRIIAQDGLFQLCRFPIWKVEQDGSKKKNSVADIKECIANELKRNIKKIYVIRKQDRKELQEFLCEKNINTPKLFPDLISICRYINSNCKERNAVKTV